MFERKENWQDMSYAFWAAFDVKRVLLAFIGVLVSVLWTCGILWPFSLLHFIEVTPATVFASFLRPSAEGACSLFSIFAHAVASGSWKAYLPLALIVFGLLAIWSIVGGAITRIAAMEYARDAKVGLVDSVKYSLKKFWSYFWGPMAPLVGVVFFVLLNALCGLIGQAPFMEVAVALGFPVIIVFSFLILFVGIIGGVGSGLMFPTISADGSDAFDAMSRAYSYVLSKPFGFLVYCASAAVYGAVCLYLVVTAIDLLIDTSLFTVGMGMGEKFGKVVTAINALASPAGAGVNYDFFIQARLAFDSLGSTTMVFATATLVFYLFLIKAIVWAVGIAFAGSAQSVLYLLMRKDVDGTEIEDVYTEEVEVDFTVPSVQPEPSPKPAAVEKQKKELKAKDEAPDS
ncbi:MAG: hypothetical protein ACYSRP_00110 [Planctomycetota bacterium]|jgi:hypothetical protein